MTFLLYNYLFHVCRAVILDDPSLHLHTNMLLCYSYHLKSYYFGERFFLIHP